MATNNNNKALNVPPLRFPEFTGEWEYSPLNEYLTENKERNKKGHFITTDVLSVSGDFGIVNQIQLLGRSFAGKSVLDYHVVRYGNIVYTKSPLKEYPYGIVKINKGADGIVSTLYAVYNVKSNAYGKFIESYFALSKRTNKYFKPIVRIGAKHDMKISNAEAIANIVCFPQYAEQQKIAEFLSLLDERITTQNKIIEDLKKLKSAISLKMLHSDSWEQFSIKDIAIIGRGRVISSVEISQQKNPTYPVYSSQTSNEGIMGYLDDYMFEGEYISWTTDGANAGTVFYRNGKFNCTNVCGLLKLKKGFDTHFVSLVLAEATKKYVSINLANPKLMNNTMGKIQIRLPKLEEQKRISLVFRRLHELLATHNSLLTEYSKQKQYLLSQMFI